MLPVARPGVICQRLEEGAVLLDSSAEVYYGLNAVGVRIWELLAPPYQTLEELCATLGAEYPEVSLETLRTDVLELLAELGGYGLVVPRGEGAAGHGDLAAPAR
jgi:hypothetical protein